jgi:tetratricopeptide (TPR) repeat protein
VITRTLLGCLLAGTTGSVANGADRSGDFAAALRQRGWTDTAVEFLAWVEDSPLISPAFRAQLPYERASALAAQAQTLRGRTARQAQLLQAAEEFEKFAAANLDNLTGIQSLREAANLYANQALAANRQAEQLPSAAEAERGDLHDQARQWLDRAISAVRQMQKACTTELAKLPKPTAIQANPRAMQLRDRLRELQVEGRFTAALLAFEQAQTFDRQSAQFKRTLEQAAAAFLKIYDDFHDTLVGASSRFYQGRCQQEMGDYQEALACFEDLVLQPAANDEFRKLTSRAHRHRAECLLALDKADQAIKDCEEWLKQSREAERDRPEWLAVAYRLTQAYAAKVATLPGGSAEVRKLQAASRQLLRDVSRQSGEFQREARLALATSGQSSAEELEPKTFADALAAGKNEFELMNSAKLSAKLAAQNNPEAVEELQAQADTHQAKASQYFEQALDLAAVEATTDDRNNVRHYLCWLYWEQDRWIEAAVLGDFLVSRYPESQQAASAAKVALAAYEKLYRQAQQDPEGDSGRFAAAQLVKLAQRIARRWPASDDATTATNLLIRIALEGGRVGEAQALLENLPAQSRSAAQLSLGTALWAEQLKQAASQTPQQAATRRQEAIALLQQGYQGRRAEATQPDSAAAVGILYLAQALLDAGQAEQAIEVLQDDVVGPLTLVNARSSAGTLREFIEETQKTALRAYLSVRPPKRQAAQALMAQLEEQLAGEGADAAARLTQIYLSLGQRLQAQMRELAAEGKTAQANQLAVTFEDILNRVSQRSDAQGWVIRNWIAQTNLQLGAGLSGNEAAKYLQRAQDQYEEILAAADKDPQFAPGAAALLGVRKRLGDTLLELGSHEAALAQYGQILRQRSALLEIQDAAAEALLQWGLATQDLHRVEQAIRGAQPQADRKNLIWGWKRMATVADGAKRNALKSATSDDRAQRFEDIFFRSQYNIARARFLAAGVAGGAARNEQLASARGNIQVLSRLYPDLGGPTWQAQFQQLLKDIEEALR